MRLLMNSLRLCRQGVLFLVILTLLSPLTLGAELNLAADHKGSSGNLAEVLRFIAQEYHVPVIAELIYPVPARVVIEPGKDSAIDLLKQVVNQVPRYSYTIADCGLIHVYEKDLLNARGNILNIQMKTFSMPANVSDLKLVLPGAISGAKRGLPSGGVVISGFPSQEMERQHLVPRELTNVTGRDVLISAASESLNFYSIIVFAKRNCTSETCFSYATQHWFWGPVSGESKPSPIYVQTPRL
jgi:hypothetical protein